MAFCTASGRGTLASRRHARWFCLAGRHVHQSIQTKKRSITLNSCRYPEVGEKFAPVPRPGGGGWGTRQSSWPRCPLGKSRMPSPFGPGPRPPPPPTPCLPHPPENRPGGVNRPDYPKPRSPPLVPPQPVVDATTPPHPALVVEEVEGRPPRAAGGGLLGRLHDVMNYHLLHRGSLVLSPRDHPRDDRRRPLSSIGDAALAIIN